MDFVQIAISPKGDGYYYDFSSGKIYRVPPGGLPDQGGQNFSGLGWVMCSGLGTVGLIGLASRVQDVYSLRTLLPGVFLLALVSSALFCRLLRRGQQRFSRAVRQQCRALTPDPALMEELRRGQKTYVQLGIYLAVLFGGAALSLVLLLHTRSLPFAVCFLIFFDAGCITATVLQPLRKIAAHSKLEHQ